MEKGLILCLMAKTTGELRSVPWGYFVLFVIGVFLAGVVVGRLIKW